MKPLLPMLFTICACVSCSVHSAARRSQTGALSDREIYDRVKLGITQAQVEKRVGKPHGPVSHGVAFYGGPPVPAWDPYGSRSIPFNVVVLYSTNCVVSGKFVYVGPDLRVVHDGDWTNFGTP